MGLKGLSVMPCHGQGLWEQLAGVYFLTIQVWTQNTPSSLGNRLFGGSSVFLNISDKMWWKFVIWGLFWSWLLSRNRASHCANYLAYHENLVKKWSVRWWFLESPVQCFFLQTFRCKLMSYNKRNCSKPWVTLLFSG